MPFLSHEIPWAALASNLQYGRTPNKNGPSYRDLHWQYNLTQTKQIEYFASTFHRVIQQHASTERKKYSTAQECTEAAKAWFGGIDDTLQPKTTEELHGSRVCSTQHRLLVEDNEDCAGSSFDALFADLECEVKYESGLHFERYKTWLDAARWVENGLPRKSIADMTATEYFDSLRDDRQACDTLNFLIYSASKSSNPNLRRNRMDRLLQMMNSPPLKIPRYHSIFMECCHTHCGYSKLAQQTLKVFNYLNILHWHLERSPILGRSSDERLVQQGLESGFVNFPYCENTKKLSDIPSYMTNPSWLKLSQDILLGSCHLAETCIFRKIFYPYNKTTQQREEMDVLSDPASFADLLKTLWKILLTCVVLMQEVDIQFNCEYVVLECLHDMFYTRRDSDSSDWGYNWQRYKEQRRWSGRDGLA